MKLYDNAEKVEPNRTGLSSSSESETDALLLEMTLGGNKELWEMHWLGLEKKTMKNFGNDKTGNNSTLLSSTPSFSVISPFPVDLGTLRTIGEPRMLIAPTSTPSTASNVLPAPNKNISMNSCIVDGDGSQRNDEVKKVLDILMRTKKRNPVLVGEAEPGAVVKELLKRIAKGELGCEGVLKNVQIISFASEKTQFADKIKELGRIIESKINGNGGIILDLGDLKCLVEQQPQQQMVYEAGRAAVVQMGKLLARFSEMNSASKIWLIGTATYVTYLRCQVYHPTMENDWDLQAVPIASKSPAPRTFPSNGQLDISEALQYQMQVQERLRKQLEVQKQLQMRIEKQGQYVKKIIEEQNRIGRI